MAPLEADSTAASPVAAVSLDSPPVHPPPEPQLQQAPRSRRQSRASSVASVKSTTEHVGDDQDVYIVGEDGESLDMTARSMHTARSKPGFVDFGEEVMPNMPSDSPAPAPDPALGPSTAGNKMTDWLNSDVAWSQQKLKRNKANVKQTSKSATSSPARKPYVAFMATAAAAPPDVDLSTTVRSVDEPDTPPRTPEVTQRSSRTSTAAWGGEGSVADDADSGTTTDNDVGADFATARDSQPGTARTFNFADGFVSARSTADPSVFHGDASALSPIANPPDASMRYADVPATSRSAAAVMKSPARSSGPPSSALPAFPGASAPFSARSALNTTQSTLAPDALNVSMLPSERVPVTSRSVPDTLPSQDKSGGPPRGRTVSELR